MTFTIQRARDLVRYAKANLQAIIINLGRTPERAEKMRQLYELEDCLKHLSSRAEDRPWTAVQDCTLLAAMDTDGLLRVTQVTPLRICEPAPQNAHVVGSDDDSPCGSADDVMHYDCPRCNELHLLVAHREPSAEGATVPEKTTVSVACLRCLRLSPIAKSD